MSGYSTNEAQIIDLGRAAQSPLTILLIARCEDLKQQSRMLIPKRQRSSDMGQVRNWWDVLPDPLSTSQPWV